LEIDQARINRFAEATGDFQWIQVEAERANDGP
jgi:acyl dehydratase